MTNPAPTTTAQAMVLTVEELEKRLAYNWVDTLRWLADRDRALTEQVRVLRPVVEWYADNSRWAAVHDRGNVYEPDAHDDAGQRARSALAALEGSGESE